MTELVGLLKQVLGKQLDAKCTDGVTEPACVNDVTQGVETERCSEGSCVEVDPMEVQKQGEATDSDDRLVTGFDKESGKWQTARKGKGKKEGATPFLPVLSGDDEISPSPELTRPIRAPGRGGRGRPKPMVRDRSSSSSRGKKCWHDTLDPPTPRQYSIKQTVLSF